jgi:hypothetical protein
MYLNNTSWGRPQDPALAYTFLPQERNLKENLLKIGLPDLKVLLKTERQDRGLVPPLLHRPTSLERD